jgi:hypothetical protein
VTKESDPVAIHKLITTPGPAGVVVVDGGTVRILTAVPLEAPKAAAFLTGIPDEHRVVAVEELLEHGAAAAAAVQTSAHVVMLQSKVDELTTQLRQDLGEQLKDAGAESKEVTSKLLESHKAELTKLLAPLMDPNAKDGLPTKLIALLDEANRNAMRHLEVMLKDGEEGAIGKAVKQISDQVKESCVAITKDLATREALLTKSNLRGLRFEDALGARMPMLVRGMGRVEHCANVPGDKGRNAGDYIITLRSVDGGETVSIVVEAKSHKNRLSANEIRRELKLARANRGAAAAILIAESSDILPDGLAFGEASDCDFYVSFDPQVGDETALTCALYMAKMAALATIAIEGGDQIDLGAAQREVSLLRGLLEQFSKIEACHSRVDKEITSARTYAGDLKADIVSALRRLDSVLTA